MTTLVLAAGVALGVGSVAMDVQLAHAGGSIKDKERASRSGSEAGSATRSLRSNKRARGRKGERVCKGKGESQRCRWVPRFEGHGLAARLLRDQPLPQPSGEISLTAVNLKERYDLDILDDDGRFDEAALARLDEAFRCRRTREHRAVDPRLFVVLSIIYDHFDRKSIELVSGFRFQRNESSRHYHAAAMDIRIQGVSTQALYEFAQSLDTGGMGIGIYPRANFVHIDYRAPGEHSYRWTDRSGPGEGDSRGKTPSKRWTRRPKPTS